MMVPVTVGAASSGALVGGAAAALTQAFRPFFSSNPATASIAQAEGETSEGKLRAFRTEAQEGNGPKDPLDNGPEGAPVSNEGKPPPTQEQVREAQQFYFQFRGKAGFEKSAEKAKTAFRGKLKAYLDHEIPLYERDIERADSRLADELKFDLSRLRLSYQAYFGKQFPIVPEDEISKLEADYKTLIKQRADNERIDRARVRWLDAQWLNLHGEILAKKDKLRNVDELPADHQGLAILNYEAAIDKLNSELKELGGIFERYGLSPIFID